MFWGLDNILNKYLTYIKFNGFVLITRECDVLLYKKYGKGIKENLSYPLASLTKQFTAAAINELVSTTSVTLDTKICDIYCKKCRVKDVSIRDLVTMRSGIADYLNDSSYKERLKKIIDLYDSRRVKEQIIIDMLNNKTKFKSGTKVEYSNSNYYLIGDIIEQVTDMSFECYLKNTIFKNFDLRETFFWHGYETEKEAYYIKKSLPYELTYSACGLYSTPDNFRMWVFGYLKSNIKRIIEGDYEYNWGLQINKKRKIVSHSGATLAQNMNFIYDYEKDILIYTWNAESKKFDAYEITTNIYKTMDSYIRRCAF